MAQQKTPTGLYLFAVGYVVE